MKKPKPKDFICEDCGVVHQEEYEKALREYKQKIKKEV